MPFQINSNRLYLREFQSSDSKCLYDLNSDPEVLLFTGDQPFKSIKEAAFFLQNYNAYKQFGYGRWAVINAKTTDFIGWCGFKYHEEGYVDLGFRMLKRHWSKGYATEASEACITYGFDALGFKEIIGRTSEHNLASIRVLQKLGFTFWKNDECEGIKDARFYLLKKNH